MPGHFARAASFSKNLPVRQFEFVSPNRVIRLIFDPVQLEVECHPTGRRADRFWAEGSVHVVFYSVHRERDEDCLTADPLALEYHALPLVGLRTNARYRRVHPFSAGIVPGAP